MRRQSREVALQILFQTEYTTQISFENLFSIQEAQKDKAIVKYADDLVKGVLGNKDKIDSKIQEASRHWKIDRMGGVDRNIMRIALFEIFYADELLDPKIVINEAIEVAKVFGSKESAAFINGILDQVIRNERS